MRHSATSILPRGKRRLSLGLLLVAMFSTSPGCMDGPFYKLKEMNPYYRNQWKKDREIGPTYTERFEELRVLDRQITSYSPDDQERWVMQLEAIVSDDPSPEFRAQTLKTIAKVKSPTATRALNRASTDNSDKVRMAACKAWKMQNDAAARDMLLQMAVVDSSSTVRMAAIESLSSFDDPEVRRGLANLLQEPNTAKDPAMMFQIAQSLKEITGRDYGGDFDSWKRYLNGEDVPEPEKPSVLSATLNSMNPWR